MKALLALILILAVGACATPATPIPEATDVPPTESPVRPTATLQAVTIVESEIVTITPTSVAVASVLVTDPTAVIIAIATPLTTVTPTVSPHQEEFALYRHNFLTGDDLPESEAHRKCWFYPGVLEGLDNLALTHPEVFVDGTWVDWQSTLLRRQQAERDLAVAVSEAGFDIPPPDERPGSWWVDLIRDTKFTDEQWLAVRDEAFRVTNLIKDWVRKGLVIMKAIAPDCDQ